MLFCDFIYVYVYLFFFFNVNLFLRERERVSREGAEERETQNPKQTPDSELSAPSPVQGLNSQTMGS